MLEVWRATTALGVATSTSSPSSAQAVARADQLNAGDYLNTALVFSGIVTIAILGLALDACLRGLLLLADPSRRR